MINSFQKAVNLIMVISLILLLAISFVFIGFSISQPDYMSNRNSNTFYQVVIEQGDTLWNLATTHAPEMDPRHTVQEIREINQLASTVVHPGQVLEIPVTNIPASVQYAAVSQGHN